MIGVVAHMNKAAGMLVDVVVLGCAHGVAIRSIRAESLQCRSADGSCGTTVRDAA